MTLSWQSAWLTFQDLLSRNSWQQRPRRASSVGSFLALATIADEVLTPHPNRSDQVEVSDEENHLCLRPPRRPLPNAVVFFNRLTQPCEAKAVSAGTRSTERVFSLHPRTVCRKFFIASALTAGRKLVNIRCDLLFAFLGRNMKPRNVKYTCGHASVRLLSLQ